MSNDKKLDETDSEIIAIAHVDRISEDTYVVETRVRTDIDRVLGISAEAFQAEFIDQIKARLIAQGQRKELTGKTTVGYNRAYADNWDNAFGKKKNDLPN